MQLSRAVFLGTVGWIVAAGFYVWGATAGAAPPDLFLAVLVLFPLGLAIVCVVALLIEPKGRGLAVVTLMFNFLILPFVVVAISNGILER